MQWPFAFLEIYVAKTGNFVCNFAEPPFAIPGIYIMQQTLKASKLLKSKGVLCYSVEHPVFTSNSSQDWYYENNKIKHWPLDNYFLEGERKTTFLGSEVIKYHRTIETQISTLLSEGFEIRSVLEPKPSDEMVEKMGWHDELRRPMMLIITAVKK